MATENAYQLFLDDAPLPEHSGMRSLMLDELEIPDFLRKVGDLKLPGYPNGNGRCGSRIRR